MNALVVYESIYGNTQAIAEAIADGLGGAPTMTPAELSAEEAHPDLLVVGGPTHMHGMATDRSRRVALEAAGTDAHGGPALRDWLGQLTKVPEARAAAFDTRLDKAEWLTGAASLGIAKRLRRHGYAVVDTASFLVTESEGPLVDGELERARQWGVELAVTSPTAAAMTEAEA
ncbi:MAG: flavodoxin family protein [Solirubrobacteraceae bacterium]